MFRPSDVDQRLPEDEKAFYGSYFLDQKLPGPRVTDVDPEELVMLQ